MIWKEIKTIYHFSQHSYQVTHHGPLPVTTTRLWEEAQQQDRKEWHPARLQLPCPGPGLTQTGLGWPWVLELTSLLWWTITLTSQQNAQQVLGHRLQATGYRLLAVGNRLQATGYKPQATSYKPQATSYWVEATGCMLGDGVARVWLQRKCNFLMLIHHPWSIEGKMIRLYNKATFIFLIYL